MKTMYSCIIVDDEEYAIGLLEESIKELYGNVNIIGRYTRWKDGLEAIRNMNADILLLDISIEGRNGMDILKMLPNLETEVIFVTAYSEYAIEAFKVSAAGYLVKPVSDTDLSRMIDRCIERIKNKKAAKLLVGGQVPVNSKIGIPNGNGVNYFDPNDILYFEAVNNYTKVVGRNFELMSSYNLGKYSYLQDERSFYQVHRSYIVNLNSITRYESSGTLIMSNKKEIPVARNFKEGFLKLFAS